MISRRNVLGQLAAMALAVVALPGRMLASLTQPREPERIKLDPGHPKVTVACWFYHGPDQAVIRAGGKEVLILREVAYKEPDLACKAITLAFGGQAKWQRSDHYVDCYGEHRPTVQLFVAGGLADRAWISFCDTDGGIRVVTREAKVEDGLYVHLAERIRIDPPRLTMGQLGDILKAGRCGASLPMHDGPIFHTCVADAQALKTLNEVRVPVRGLFV